MSLGDNADTQAAAAEPTQVLEFQLGDERYCVVLDAVTEIIDRQTVRSLPDVPSHVVGAMDYRGVTTTLVDTACLLGVGSNPDASRVIVFDAADEDATVYGWLVDEVDRVTDIAPETVDDAPFGDERTRGIVRSDDGLVVWVDPPTND
ncbi:purine-binding chemotaxis protein CheW (plasmid) [Haloferax mediterranei ATCC 33500]|uniref:Chemotaxis protein CheW n=1 Tax=Haloferax mediterranei (strain ATCC 33500 / DSM 1411 / JCM 8866 / NBRC 14739 / NCIMB 2177 / R-4) TaxID=523841 RepID=I3RB02_HALMT|nr:chemotaxis protein CheW [Haloferax mediterranei]AFK21412.1 chemotaxis protein CheW [Haloferax mediterranei ATCC 33500]AHZ24518.1 chemotaxis protein CheW [Haloferax mediterranei ATCC 33500]ELZ97270.1 chemotaxis protein CheW [Haloferax mediterranei ATCC 33500]MDX5990428.1 chemotaxis protein CheW [Haloferax mediterranei ATCC 33500]QCQ76914.1 purine-binding chemotaxis protein CheW [Haloferax mediterranei ATCC 33500]